MLGAERPHIFEGDGRVIRVDAVEGAGIANIAPGDEGDSGSVPANRSQQMRRMLGPVLRTNPMNSDILQRRRCLTKCKCAVPNAERLGSNAGYRE